MELICNALTMSTPLYTLDDLEAAKAEGKAWEDRWHNY